MKLFTPEELEEMRRADEEIEANFSYINEELAASRKRDKDAKLDRKTNKERRSAENQRAYREANREKIAENKRAYYEANREKIAENQRNLLRSFRKGLGYTQKDFASLLGIRQPTISMWENGAIPICLSTLGKAFPELARKIKEAE